MRRESVMAKTRDVSAGSYSLGDWFRRILRGVASKTDSMGEIALSDLSPDSSTDSDPSQDGYEDIQERPTASHVAFFDTTDDIDEAKMKAKEFAEIERHIQRFKG